MPRRYLTTREAIERLGVTPATLYSYVSRGLVRSEAAEADNRSRRYLAEDVDKLVERRTQRRNPEKAAQGALYWGVPVLDSALTLIANNRLYYRGQEVTALAQTESFERVAALLWAGTPDEVARVFGQVSSWEHLTPILNSVRPSLAPVERANMAVMLAARADIAAYNLRAEAVALTGGRILQAMAGIMAEVPPEVSIARTLQEGWCRDIPAAERLFNAALILCADHELNVSAFTARVVSSAATTPYYVILAGLAALTGLRHGGMTARTEDLFHQSLDPDQVEVMLSERMRRGETIPGFGHRLYPDGDPRGTCLLSLLDQALPDSAEKHIVDHLRKVGQSLTGEPPTIDFALAALAYRLRLPRGAGIALFALGRTAGWIGHAIEQIEQGDLIRPRATYTGRLPD